MATQSKLCKAFHSPFYAELLSYWSDHLDDTPVLKTVLETYPEDPASSLFPLRILGGVHYLVLTGQAEALVSHYPSVGGTPTWPEAWQCFTEVVNENAAFLQRFVLNTPQTNEVTRSAGLLGGFLNVAALTQKPLRLFEIGSSAGLNQNWHHYGFLLSEHRWGPSNAEVQIESQWDGGPPELQAKVQIDRSSGCDIAPIDLNDPAERMRLMSYVWPEHRDRFERLKAAISFAQKYSPSVIQSAAADWLETELVKPVEGVTRVLFHSAVWFYLPQSEQQRIQALMERAGQAATSDTPLAWVQVEHGTGFPELSVQIWPEGKEVRLAQVHPFGTQVRWLG